MLRYHLFHKRAPADPMFRWRGGDVSRIEALSDGVFAIAIALLVVSLAVPSNFGELWATIRDFPAFAVCFILLVMCWYYHYIFFRRYGLEDFLTIALNLFLLFLVLFYVYPLKFLFTRMWHGILGILPPDTSVVNPDNWFLSHPNQGLMIVYGLGVVAIFGVFWLMTWRAWRMRDALELDELEQFLARGDLRTHLIMVAVALASVSLAATTEKPIFAGFIYFLYGPLHFWNGSYTGSRAVKIRERLTEASAEQK